MAKKKKEPCLCLDCPEARPFNDGQRGIVCNRTLEACFMDCDNCSAWCCSIRRYELKKAKVASQTLHVL
jgi:hypothetical protein